MSSLNDSQPALDLTQSVTIANGAALSNAIDILGTSLQGVLLPAVWTAAAMTFAVSFDGITYFPLFDSTGAEVSYTVVQGHAVFFPTYNWRMVRYLKIRSGTLASPVNQGQSTVVTLALRLGA